MTESALLRATRYLSQAQAEVRRLERLKRLIEPKLASARANVVARRHEVARLEAEAGGAR